MVPAWQAELARSYTRVEDLLRDLELDLRDFPGLGGAAERFPFRVTRSFAARMRKADPYDPLLRQVLPLGLELQDRAGFDADPVGDLRAVSAPGVLRKYQGRALLITTGACAIHCRYCFRREFPYGEHRLGPGQEAALDFIRQEPGIRELILSGGDPLVLSDERLGHLLARIVELPRIRRLRLHTRLPVVLPSRITEELLRRLSGTRLKTVLVIHANHPAEFDGEVRDALQRLNRAGMVLLNQSVLLRGVNDEADTLIRLSETLFEHGVLPYYLHLLDRVRGTAHFEVSETHARKLLRRLREALPGYLVPKLVREVSGEASKSPVG